MRLLIYTSKAPSLSEVGRQIGYVAEKLGFNVIMHRHMVYISRWSRVCDASIFIFPFNPILLQTYFLQYRDAKKEIFNVLFYTTVEGKIPQFKVPVWIREEVSFVACSNYVRRKIEESGCRVETVVFHGYPEWELDRIGELSNKYISILSKNVGDKVRFCVVSSDHPRKALDKVVEAIRLAYEKTKDFVVLFLIPRSAVKVIANCEPCIYVGDFGSITHPEVLAFYYACHYVIYCTYAEGFGLVLLEANAVGRPCIINNLPPFREFADMKNNLVVNYREIRDVNLNEGILYEYHIFDVKELADMIVYAVDIYRKHRSEYLNMCVKVKEKVRDLTATRQYTKLLSLIKVFY